MRRWWRSLKDYRCEICGRAGRRAWFYHDMFSPGGDANGRRFM